MAQLWGGRFKKSLNELAKAYSFSFEDDKRLYLADIAVNKAHASALHAANILTDEEHTKVQNGLDALPEKFVSEILNQAQEDEDIHSCVERLLIEEIGDLGKKIHTGKSRNDQVATDARIYLRDETLSVICEIEDCLEAILEQAKSTIDIPFPGFTHLQVAQPVRLAHHWLAYAEKLKRDRQRFQHCLTAIDECPMGSAALAGSNYPLDREAIATELGFSRLTQNSMDAVSNRDYMLDWLSAAATTMSHLSQLCEELIIWSSSLTGFIEIGDEFTTGSSIMPQKKNPDIAELMRGKSAKVIGNLNAFHVLLKAQPSTYNRDLQEDKPLLYASVDTLKQSLALMAAMLPTISFNTEAISTSLEKGFPLATELADYLVMKGVAFRDAHEITGKIVGHCVESKQSIESQSLAQLQAFSPAIEADIHDCLSIEAALEQKSLLGGTAKTQVQFQIEALESLLDN